MPGAISHAFSKVFGSDAPVETPKTEERAVGKIIKVSEQGWGFISCKDIKWTRIFFHWTSLRQDTLNFADVKVGMMCEFTPIQIEGKGTRAIKIKILPQEELTVEQQDEQAEPNEEVI
jgi:hypothetical protein